MSARARLVYFILDPYSDARAPVAALLQDDHTTSLVRADAPTLRASAEFAVARALADIEAGRDFDTLPSGAGPHFVMGEPRTLPAGVANPSRWVRDHLLRAA
jgi:hypothetical protein